MSELRRAAPTAQSTRGSLITECELPLRVSREVAAPDRDARVRLGVVLLVLDVLLVFDLFLEHAERALFVYVRRAHAVVA